MSSRSQESSSVVLDRDNPVYGQATGFRTGFAPTYPTSSTTCTQTVYAQSLLSAGNGIPLSDAAYSTLSDTPGVVIGDVGWVDLDGTSHRFLNIFRRSRPSGYPPRNFKPVEKPLSEWNVKRTPSFFPPGTILTSHGIEVLREPGSLLVDVNTTVPHGAVLCLPDGAERMDLVDADALRSYVAEHALDWYRYINGYSGEGSVFNLPNGTLFLVTGADSAPRVGQYNENENVWETFNYNITNAMTSQVGPDYPGILGICFIRGFAIGLGSALWTHYSPRPDPADVEGAFGLRFAPTLSLNTRSDRRRGWYVNFAKWLPVRKGGHGVKCTEREPLNVLALVLQVMLVKAPSADVLMVHDSIFKGTEEFDFYYPGIFDKLTHIFQHYNVIIEDGLARMMPIPSLAVKAQDKANPSSSFWRIFNPFSRQSRDQSRDDLWKSIRRGHNISQSKS